MICGYKCSCRTLENCTGGTVLAVMRSTLEISTSYLKKAAEVLPVRCPLQKSKFTTNKRIYLQGKWKKGCQANIQITNSIFAYNIVCTPSSPQIIRKMARKIREENTKSETGLEEGARGVGYPQLLHKTAYGGSTSQKPPKATYLRPKGNATFWIQVPACTCKEYHSPCKHSFGVFHLLSQRGWEKLP